jgi:ribosomal protein S12 methylthiotransferase
MKFERLGVFAYSKEEGTRAASMENQVPKSTKLARRERIMKLQQEISLKHNIKKVGQLYEVIVEESEDGFYMGRTSYDAPEIDNKVIFTCDKPLLPGDFVMVEITDAFDYDLSGKVVDNYKKGSL